MTQSKNTKRALLASVLSTLLCVAMLIGSTFAWFTDSVSSVNNKIVAGNLDVDLRYQKENTWTPVDQDTNLFMADALWEPGHVEVIPLQVVNLGTLALQYRFSVNIASETGSINVSGEEFKLSDFIRFAVVEGNQSYATREAAIAAAEAAEPTLISSLNVDNQGVLYPAQAKDTPSEQFVTLIVYMPGTVGNEANYKTGENPPQITLGVNLTATQTPYESDSFDNQYDANAAGPVEPGDSTFAVSLVYTQEVTEKNPDPNDPKFLAAAFETEDSTLFQTAILRDFASSRTGYDGCQYTFSVKGSATEDRKLTFDFGEKCAGGDSYKGHTFEGGFGGFGDTYVLAGTYGNLTLVGDYYPVVVTVTHSKGDALDFTFTGSLTALIQELSNHPVLLEAGTEYDEEFTITVNWPWETFKTDTCYVMKNGKIQDTLDEAESLIGNGASGTNGELWADFEVMIQPAA